MHLWRLRMLWLSAAACKGVLGIPAPFVAWQQLGSQMFAGFGMLMMSTLQKKNLAALAAIGLLDRTGGHSKSLL